MTLTGISLKTKRYQAHYADKILLGDKPAALVKSGKKEDILTTEDFVEGLYGRPVDYIDIHFKGEKRTDIF